MELKKFHIKFLNIHTFIMETSVVFFKEKVKQIFRN